jgi:hypothetical protein
MAVGCGPELVEGSSQQALTPSLLYSTLLAAPSGGRGSQDVAVDRWGNAYIVGFQSAPGGPGFLAKYSPTGQSLFVESDSVPL